MARVLIARLGCGQGLSLGMMGAEREGVCSLGMVGAYMRVLAPTRRGGFVTAVSVGRVRKAEADS